MNTTALRHGLLALLAFIFVLGFSSAATGFFFRYNIGAFRELMDDQLASFKVLTGLSEERTDLLLDDLATDIAEGSHSIFLCLGFYGAATAIAAFLGLIGVGIRENHLLITFCLILTFLMIGQTIGISILGNDRAHISSLVLNYLKPHLSEYRGLNGTNKGSFVWNLIMSQLKCCGLQNGHELLAASVPVCCKRDSSLQILYCGCPENQIHKNSFIDVGCKPVILAIVHRFVNILIVCVFLGLIVQSFALVISFILIKQENQ